jgi:N-acetylmuramoyl-L-alanine amidase
MKNRKIVFGNQGSPVVLAVIVILILSLAGCSTVAVKDSLPTYTIQGISYAPLIAVCKSAGVECNYDSLTRTAMITKDAHKINLMVGQDLIFVDGKPRHLKHDVEFYQGTVVVPSKFKEQILDALLKEPPPSALPGAGISKIKKIVVDAGHGGYDPGAIGKTGLREKSINLDIAKRLAKVLRRDGIQVVMTRSSDTFISLQQRVDIANASKADLFVSIHTNANHSRSLNGFEVYYISPNVGDSARALNAAQSAVLDIDRNCFDKVSLNLKATLWDMIYTNNRAESIELAQSICKIVDHDLDIKILGIKSAGFYVLKGARMPAVLVEIGYVSNKSEERLLKNTYYRQQIADAVAQGITDYGRERALAEASK